MAGMPADKAPEVWELPKSRGLLDNLLEGGLGAQAELSPAMTALLREAGVAERVRPALSLLQLRRDPV